MRVWFDPSIYSQPTNAPVGSDTTALTLVTTIYQFIKHPSCLEKLRTELDSAFPKAESIRLGLALPGCKYLRACIDEAMRLTPAVGGVLPREVLAPGTSIAGEHLPAGTTVRVASYTLHRNSSYFSDPHSYWPERWIASDATGVDENDVKRAQSAFFAFSIGPRGCVGKQLAYTELSLAVAHIVWLYDMELLHATMPNKWLEKMSQASELPTVDKFVSHPAKGLRFRFKLRK